MSGFQMWGVGTEVGEPGQTLSIFVANHGLDVRAGPGTFDGVFYPRIFYDGFLEFRGDFVIPDGPDQLTLTTPFLFRSALQGCSSSTFASGCPSSDFIFDMNLIGEGTATVSLVTFPFAGRPVFQISGVTYEFAPIPEPGTLVLLGTGLATLAAAARRSANA